MAQFGGTSYDGWAAWRVWSRGEDEHPEFSVPFPELKTENLAHFFENLAHFLRHAGERLFVVFPAFVKRLAQLSC